MAERLSRALMTLGEGLGSLANVTYSRERDEAQAALTRERDAADRIHQESLVRLRGQMDSQAQTRDIDARNKVAEDDRRFSAEQSEKDRAFRGSESGKDRALMTQRLDDAERQRVETHAADLMAKIDSRVTELRDQITKYTVEGMGTLDPSVQASIADELAQLQTARRGIRHRMIEQLASMGDPRYADLSPRQMQVLLGEEISPESGGGTDTEEPPATTVEDKPRNPDAVIADEIIQRPKRQRRRLRLTLGTDLYNPKPLGSEPLGGSGLRDAIGEGLRDFLQFGGADRFEAMSGRRQLADERYASDERDRRDKGSM